MYLQKSASIQPRTSLSKFRGDSSALFIRPLLKRSRRQQEGALATTAVHLPTEGRRELKYSESVQATHLMLVARRAGRSYISSFLFLACASGLKRDEREIHQCNTIVSLSVVLFTLLLRQADFPADCSAVFH